MRRRELAGWLVAGVLLMVAAARPGADEVRCKKLVIEIANGETRMVLTTTDRGEPMIGMNSGGKRIRFAILMMEGQKPVLVRYDADGEPSFSEFKP